ncbi:rhamnogalacturonan lyase [Alteromonas gilva]|uniref:Rhamnogalacturonan lyase n=1 Tax=Alteromonas gilva TaxID=2987522 RepID=A0ABT5L7T9_9ALTE|nr:rhamnogalacturonan lyase [Alteromonas gilva]MDC8832494.1 rhamnogalacturonan lyase [Alteromonas gilva]
MSIGHRVKRGTLPLSQTALLLGTLLLAQGCERDVEALDRGLVAQTTNEGVTLSWRLLGNDHQHVRFNVFKNGRQINGAALQDATFFTDPDGSQDDSYYVEAVVGNKTYNQSRTVAPWQQPYLSIPLIKPRDGFIEGNRFSYVANDGSAADLDGDGRYEVLVQWEPTNSKDNSQSGATGDVLLDAYTLEGQRLWRINLGPNIRAGAHYTQFIAYDFDGDGRAEVAMKTADGSMDGQGNIIGDADAVYRNSAGYVLSGPEYLTMFDGLTGKALDTIDYVPQRGTVTDWGDGYGNRVDRFLAGAGYFDGKTPSLVMARGYYTRAVVAAFDFNHGKFKERWVFDSDNGGADGAVFGQGAHSLHVADVDGDGKDEIVYGAATIDDNGHALYSTNLCHGDAVHVGDLDPERDGLEVFMVHESPGCYANAEQGYDYGFEMHDAATGEILWGRSGEGRDVGRGVSANIDPRYPGNENWSSRGGMVSAAGEDITNSKPRSMNFAVYWDGDLLRELLDHTRITKWDYINEEENLIIDTASLGAVSNNGTKGNAVLSADILGDWREEVIWANTDSTELMVFSSTHSTEVRIPTLMHDRQYRLAIAWQNVGYNQPPHPSFYIGEETSVPASLQVKAIKPSPLNTLVARGYDDYIGLTVYSDAKHNTGDIDIYRNTEDSYAGAVFLAALSEGQTRFDDTTAEPDTRYFYWASVDNKKKDDVLLAANAKRTGNDEPFYDIYLSSETGAATLSWFTDNIELSQIDIYRQRADSESVPADFTTAELADSVNISQTNWTDTSAQPGEGYYYWIVFTDTEGREYGSDVYWNLYLLPTTNLTTRFENGAVTIDWNLQYFPEIRGIQFYRNTRNQLSGRERISTSVPTSGSFSDGTVASGVTYWYMFKITLADGSTYNTNPEGQISIP